MKQVLQHVRSRRLQLADVPAPACRPGGVLVRTDRSLISAGTERMVIDFASKSMLGKARERPDLVRQVVDKVRKEGLGPTVQTVLSRLEQPIALGYSCAGTVVEVGAGVTEFAPGDRVACAGMGYASHAEVVYVPRNLAVAIPDGVSFDDASYVTLGAIALHGVRVADVRLGDRVVVIGLGLLGLLAVQILKASGCAVLGIDLDPHKVALARQLGADAAVARTADVEGAVAAFTGGVGADAVVVAAATDSNDPIELAGSIARDRATVTVVGAVRMDVPRKPFYEKELDLRLSRSYGPGRYDPAYEERGQDYPIGYVRWTERRNMQEFLRLVATGRVTPEALTTHRYPIDDAASAYSLITGETGAPFCGVLLTYDTAAPAPARTSVLRAPSPVAGRVGVGFIGAGNFARAVLLPRLKGRDGVSCVGLATSTGASARGAAESFGFGYATTDVQQVLDDERVHAVFIATRHGSHARLAARALAAGKAVFVEKPLAIDAAGLAEVVDAWERHGGLLSVGFNRRFSPLAHALRDRLPAARPMMIQYRVNAGAIPREHWLHDPADGGGRIIGEGCHFVDFLQFLTRSRPVEVFAAKLGGADGDTEDTVALTIRYADGSLGTISYAAVGDRGFAKERVEVFAGGTVAVLDDLRELTVSRGGKRHVERRRTQAKGYDEELAAFLTAARDGGAPPIPLDELVATTEVTFAAIESLRSGAPVPLVGDAGAAAGAHADGGPAHEPVGESR